MVLPDYLSDIANEMRRKSVSIRRDFRTHHASAGENREDAVKKFLAEHLPKRFGVSAGLVLSPEGTFSKQADILIVDALNNAPLYGAATNQIWLAEAVFALIEVKTVLGPTELRDAIAKGRRFKNLTRRYFDFGRRPRINDSLFIIWAFDCAEAALFKENLLGQLSHVPRSEQPDLIIVPDKLFVSCGAFLELQTIGQPNSEHRAKIHAVYGEDLSPVFPPVLCAECGPNSLMVWYLWLYSWLMQAGDRCASLPSYLPPESLYGRMV